MMSSPPTRLLGSTSVEVSEVGLGCNRIGEDILSDSGWIALLNRAVDLGVTLFDTATLYASGRSEELIGLAFGNRQDVTIATKVLPSGDPKAPRFSRKTVIEGAERSLRALRRNCIDILQTHGGGALDEICDPEWSKAMALLKEQGKIRFRGSALFDAKGGIYAVENGLVDVLQVTYNLIDVGHALPIIPVAEKYGVGLIARMPYQRGILTGKFSSPEADASSHRAHLQRQRFPADVLAAEQFRELGEGRPGGMPALAMQFVLAEKRISCTIPGARSIDQLEANLAAAAAPGLTEDEFKAIAEIQNDAPVRTSQ